MQATPCMPQNLLYDAGLVRTAEYPFAPHVEPCGFEIQYPEIMLKKLLIEHP